MYTAFNAQLLIISYIGDIHPFTEYQNEIEDGRKVSSEMLEHTCQTA